jgi:predicted DNA-binding WGR domain protein
MIAQPYRLHIQRVDPNRNMARYYELSLEPTLFGEISLVRTWGRIGRRGQQRVDQFPTEKQALELFLELLRKKRVKGYKPDRTASF